MTDPSKLQVHRSDYFDPPTCEDCYAILDSDGNHWASGKPTCSPHRLADVQAEERFEDVLREAFSDG